MPFYNPADPAFVPSVDLTSVGFGINSIASVSTGLHLTAIGNKSLTANTTGSNNVALGGLTGQAVTTGSSNTIMGHNAGSTITTGSTNTVIGKDVASTTLTTGSNNILIGTSSAADAATASTSNSLWIGGGATAVMSATAINSTPVVTIPGSLIVTGSLTHNGGSIQAPVAAGATKTLTATNAGSTILLDTAAGSVVTLPAATGSGATYKFVVTTTASSNAHKILAASVSDFLNGIAMGYTGSTAKVFGSAAATNHSIQMPFTGSQPSGGFIGDYFTFTDVGANLWTVNAMYQAGTTPTTPFSSATT